MTERLQAAIKALQNGEMVILVDSEDRENEGDLVLAAQFATAEKINFFVRKACGLVCLSLEATQVDQLKLPPMVSQNQTPRKTAFTISIEAAKGISTGISPADRAHTILVASSPDAKPEDLVAPGHIFPLRASPGGVLERAGHTEGSIELCRLAGLRPAAVICEIINEDGSMARMPDLEKFSKTYQIPILTIEELIRYRAERAEWLEESRPALFPNIHSKNPAPLKIKSFRNKFTGAEHAVVYTETLVTDNADLAPLVRVHSECLTGDSLGSLRCDCGFQLDEAIERISESPTGGAVVYVKNQEGRGIGLWNKIEAYALQDEGADTFDANVMLGFHPDLRDYQDAAKMIRMMGLTRIRLLTNNPKKVDDLKAFGIDVVERVSLEMEARPENEAYLRTKRERFQHHIGNL